MPNVYSPSKSVDAAFFTTEGHTLWNDSPQSTRIPKKGNLRETLLIMKADIETACKKSLTDEERLALIIFYGEFKPVGRPSTKLSQLATTALAKVVDYLNGPY